MRGLRAISYLPTDEVLNGAVELLNRLTPFFNTRCAIDKAKVKKLIFYFKSNYLGVKVQGVDQPARFAIHKWNNFQAAKDGRSRSNNFTEGRNRAMKRQHYKGAPPKLSFCLRLDRKEEWKTSNRYVIARDNPMRDGSPRPITMRSGRLRAKMVSQLLRTECELYERDPQRGSAARRQQHIESIGATLSLYQHKRDARRRKDQEAMTVDEVEELRLPAPGATEEDAV